MGEGRKKLTIVLLMVLVVLAGCGLFGPDGTDVDDDGGVEAAVHSQTSTVCYYEENPQGVGQGVGSIDCVRPDSVPDSYSTFAELDKFRVSRDEKTDTICYEWVEREALSCLPTPESDAGEQSPTDET